MARTFVHDFSIFVQESLAAADPFYEGPKLGQQTKTDDDIRPLDANKTAHDLGRYELHVWIPPEPHLTGPVGGAGPEPTLDASHKREAL